MPSLKHAEAVRVNAPSHRTNAERDTLSYSSREVFRPTQGGRKGFGPSQAEATHMGGFYGSEPLVANVPHSSPFRDAQGNVEALLGSRHRKGWHSPMSEEEPGIIPVDPMVGILAAFYLIPNEYQDGLFDDFRRAAEAHDLRRLLDTISDWSATAQLYDHPTLASELKDAIGGRKGVADWLPG